jgi:ankyrin repeat protein
MTSHAHIVKFVEILESKHRIFLVMENCTGGELYDYIQDNRKLAEPEAARLFYQIVSAVAQCHAKGIIHRDLKPENILLDSDRNAKIVDFGLCTHVQVTFDPNDQSQMLTTQCGSPHYAAPEILNERPYFGPQVDVWSLGVILFAMLCGKLPFNAREMHLLCRIITAGRFVIPPHVSPGAAKLIKEILNLRADRRPTCEQILKNEWLQEMVDQKTKDACLNAEEKAEAQQFSSTETSQCAACAAHARSEQDGVFMSFTSEQEIDTGDACTCGQQYLEKMQEKQQAREEDIFVERFVESYFQQQPQARPVETPVAERKRMNRFFDSISDGDIEAVTAEIDAGFDLAVTDNLKWTALHYAARRGHFNILHTLLTSFQKNPVDIDARTHQAGWTPLMMAADRGKTECCQLLLEFGAEMMLTNSEGKSAVFLARESGHNELAVQMTKYCAFLAKRARTRANVSGTNTLDDMFLRAAEIGDLEIITHLLELETKQASRQTNKVGRRPGGKQGRHRVAMPDSKLNVQAKGGNNLTALHYSARNGHHTIVETLLPYFTSSGPDIKTKGGWTPLMMAALKGHQECARLLIQARADPQVVASDGCSPILLAREGKHVSMLGLFQHALRDSEVNVLDTPMPVSDPQQSVESVAVEATATEASDPGAE